MKKKVIAGMLILALAFSITACGKDNKDAEKGAFKAQQQDKEDDKEADDEDSTDEDLQDENLDDEDMDEEQETTAERGTFEGNVYTNNSMGIQVTFPENCTVLSDEEMKQAEESSSDIMEENYDSEAVEKSMSGTIFDVMATIDGSTSIQIMLEDTKITTGMRLTADLYAQALVSNLKLGYESAGMDIGEPAVTEETLGGVDFSVVTLSANGMTQEYYIHQVDNNIMGIILTYTDDGAIVEEFLNSITAL